MSSQLCFTVGLALLWFRSSPCSKLVWNIRPISWSLSVQGYKGSRFSHTFTHSFQGAHLFFKRNPKNFHFGHLFPQIFLPIPQNFHKMFTLYFPEFILFSTKVFIFPQISKIFANWRKKSFKWHSFYDTPNGNWILNSKSRNLKLHFYCPT